MKNDAPHPLENTQRAGHGCAAVDGDPIRIAHVATQLTTGGMERLLVEFARHADRRRYSLRFIALGELGAAAAEIKACGWPVIGLDMQPGLRPSVIYRLARLLRDERIDLVHTHNTKPLTYAGAAARLAGIRGVVHTRHGRRHGEGRRKTILFRLACRCADRVVCVSEDSANLCRSEGVSADQVQTIWNGIDTGRFTFSGPNEDGPVVFVGRLSPEKDVATLLRAAAIVASQRPSFRLEIAGDGPCRAELATMVQALGLHEHVCFLGEVRDVPALLRHASVFVLPSLTEGLPLSVLEAMACGLPVVATRVGGTPEALADGETGLLVDSGDVHQLAVALMRVCGDSALARSMGLEGHRRVTQLFGVRTMVSRYETLYEEVLGSNAHRRAA